MTIDRRKPIAFHLLPSLLLSAALLFALSVDRIVRAEEGSRGQEVASSGRASQESAPAPSGRQAQEPYMRGVTRKGGLVVISKGFAGEVRENNAILLSKVAIKASLDKNGGLRGYEAVQIDKGSVVERMGFRPHDLVVSVNAIPARDLEASRESLESADRFDVAIVRNGKTMRLRFEIR